MPGPEPGAIRLLLVDDHAIVRQGLRAVLATAPQIEVVGEASTMQGAIADAARLGPDVILMDVRLPDGTGIEACREIRSARAHTRVLFLTSFADDEALLATLFAGGDGYLLKEIDEKALIRAIEAVASGQSIMDAAMTHRMLAHIATLAAPPSGDRRGTLTEQERNVLALVAAGHTNKAIAFKARPGGSYCPQLPQRRVSKAQCQPPFRGCRAIHPQTAELRSSLAPLISARVRCPAGSMRTLQILLCLSLPRTMTIRLALDACAPALHAAEWRDRRGTDEIGVREERQPIFENHLGLGAFGPKRCHARVDDGTDSARNVRQRFNGR
jgi:two-component system, NarL family, response regulator DevR